MRSDIFFMENKTLTGTFFCVIKTEESFPRTAIAVFPPLVAAFRQYSFRNQTVKGTKNFISSMLTHLIDVSLGTENRNLTIKISFSCGHFTHTTSLLRYDQIGNHILERRFSR